MRRAALIGLGVASSGLSPAPTLASVYPDWGIAAGGTSVTVTGTHITSITFAGVAASLVDNGDGTYTATTAAGAPAIGDVVATHGSKTATLTNGWMYAPTTLVRGGVVTSQNTTVAAGVCSQWNDASGNARHYTASSTAQPAYNATGVGGLYPCLTGDGVDDVMSATGFGVANPVTVFMVLRNNTVYGTNKRIWSGRDSNFSPLLYQVSGGLQLYAGGAGVGHNNDLPADRWGIVQFTSTSGAASSITVGQHTALTGTSGTQTVTTNGTSIFGLAGPAATAAGGAQASAVSIAAEFSLSNASAGDKAIMLAYLHAHYGRAVEDVSFMGDGDSVMLGYLLSGPSYAQQVATFEGKQWTLSNFGVTSQPVDGSHPDSASTMQARLATAVGSTCNNGYWRNVALIRCGINDINYGATAATVYTRLQTYVATLRAQSASNLKVFIETIIPCDLPTDGNGTQAAKEAERVALNALIRAGWQTFCDGPQDTAALTHYSAAADTSDATYYNVDKRHPADTGVTNVIAPSIEATFTTAAA